MYAIVDIAGKQFKVEKDQKLFVHRLDGEAGNKVTFEKVYLIDNDKSITVGDPVVKGAAVSATILNHLKADKVLVFKKKRRKGYQKLNGHRQYLSQIQIDSISEKGAKPAEKAAAVKEDAPAEKKAAPVKAAEKKAAPAKAAEKKSTAAPKKAAPAKAESKPKAAAAKPKAETAKPKAAKAVKKDDTGKGVEKK